METPTHEQGSAEAKKSTQITTSKPPSSSTIIEPIFFPHPSHSQESHTDYIYNMALTTTHLITASKDRTIRIWSLATQRLAHPPLESHTAAVLCVAVHEAKNLLFSGSVDKRMIVWDMESWDCVRVVEDAHEESVLSIAASEKFVVTASQDKTVKVWDIEHLARTDSSSIVTPMRCLTGHAAAVNALALTSDNIITGSGDRTIRIWDIETLTCIRTIQGHFEKGIAALALLPSGGKVVAGGSDMTVRIFDVATGVEEACLRGHTNLARSVCAMPGENEDEGGEVSIVSGSYDGKVRVWGRVQKDEEGWETERTFEVYQALSKDTHGKGVEGEFKVFKVLSAGRKIFCANTSSTIVAWEVPQSEK